MAWLWCVNVAVGGALALQVKLNGQAVDSRLSRRMQHCTALSMLVLMTGSAVIATGHLILDLELRVVWTLSCLIAAALRFTLSPSGQTATLQARMHRLATGPSMGMALLAAGCVLDIGSLFGIGQLSTAADAASPGQLDAGILSSRVHNGLLIAALKPLAGLWALAWLYSDSRRGTA
ncbi:hypothetical protein [Paenibacillus sp. 1P07SE]|uniref:hypothetical protein n=1 Tax=Paenibacillus sp. 1P07SE TaxID=3132209 RepID=UPI0039A757F3